MGKKVNPRIFRRTTNFQVPSRWFASKYQFPAYLQTDLAIRKLIKKRFRDGGVALVEIERSVGQVVIIIHTSKPGVVIGRGGAMIEEVRKQIKRELFGSEKMNITVTIQEVKNPDLHAELIVQSIRDQLEARVPFRRAIKRALEQVMRANAKGCRIQVGGRLNGSEIARSEKVSRGRLPLHTLRAHIDYSRGIAQTIYGTIGIKVWIYTGDLFGDEQPDLESKTPERKRTERKRLQTDGKKFVLRKKVDVEQVPVITA
jgi:small subunit ribosomal protein S3